MAFIQRNQFQLYTETTPGERGKTSSYEVIESTVYSSSSSHERGEVTFIVLLDCLRVGNDTQQILRAAFAAVRDECTTVNRPIAERLRRALKQADEGVKRIVRAGDRASSGGVSIFIAALADMTSSGRVNTTQLQVIYSGNISSYWWHVDRVYPTPPQRLTIGHTWGQQNLALGLVTEQNKGDYPQWYTPIQYLGAGEPIRPDQTLSTPKDRAFSTTDGLALRPDDRVILCTAAISNQALLAQAGADKTDARHFAKTLVQRPADTKTDRTVLLIDCRKSRAQVDWTTGVLGFARWFGRWWWRTFLLLLVLGALGWGWQYLPNYGEIRTFVVNWKEVPGKIQRGVGTLFETPTSTPTATVTITPTLSPVTQPPTLPTATATIAPIPTNPPFEISLPARSSAVPVTQTINPTNTPSRTPTATNTPLPVPTTPFPATTDTPVPISTATPVPAVTETGTLTPTENRRTVTTNEVILLKPESGHSADKDVDFFWSSSYRLQPGQALEWIIWPPGTDPLVSGMGLKGPVNATGITLNFEELVNRGQIAEGEYLWGIRLIDLDPFHAVTMLSEARTIYVKISQGPEPVATAVKRDD